MMGALFGAASLDAAVQVVADAGVWDRRFVDWSGWDDEVFDEVLVVVSGRSWADVEALPVEGDVVMVDEAVVRAVRPELVAAVSALADEDRAAVVDELDDRGFDWPELGSDLDEALVRLRQFFTEVTAAGDRVYWMMSP